MRVRTVTATASLILIAVSVTACSTSTASGAGAGATGAAPGQGASVPTGGSGTGKGPTCKQLTFADVQPLLIQKVSSVAVSAAFADGNGQQCVFTGKNSDSTGAITIQVNSGTDATQAYTAGLAGLGSNAASVSGVGDKANRDREDGDVISMHGGEFCSVSASDTDIVPGVGALEEAHGATLNIGDAAWDTLAKALGTLCNRIYGGGNATPDLSPLTAAAATATPSDGGGLPTQITLPSDGPTS
jgi:hypothetical protein